MVRLWTAMIAVLVWRIGIAGAEVIEVPLPALHGIYKEGGTTVRTAAFHLDPPPMVVHAAWIRLSGDATGGTTECEGGGTNPWPFDFSAAMMDSTTGGFWLAGGWTSGETGRFDMTDGFSPLFGAGWGFLRDGYGEVELSGVPSPLVGMCWPVTPPPEAIVEEAVLIIDAAIPVPAEPTTWGSIKALYE
jgi:hypothetical protein